MVWPTLIIIIIIIHFICIALFKNRVTKCFTENGNNNKRLHSNQQYKGNINTTTKATSIQQQTKVDNIQEY